MLASIGTNRAGKRAAMMHLMFNVIGTILFIPICLLLHYPEFIMRLTDNPEMQISYAHIGFNIVTTVIMFPFAQLLVKLSQKLIPARIRNMRRCGSIFWTSAFWAPRPSRWPR